MPSSRHRHACCWAIVVRLGPRDNLDLSKAPSSSSGYPCSLLLSTRCLSLTLIVHVINRAWFVSVP